MKRAGINMERQLFTWVDWDEIGHMCFTFYNCTVVKPFGIFNVGDKLHCVVIDFDDGSITVCQNASEPFCTSWQGKLVLSVEIAPQEKT